MIFKCKYCYETIPDITQEQYSNQGGFCNQVCGVYADVEQNHIRGKPMFEGLTDEAIDVWRSTGDPSHGFRDWNSKPNGKAKGQCPQQNKTR